MTLLLLHSSGARSPRNATRTLKKGMRVFVAGKLVQRSWQDNDSNKHQSVEIQVTHLGPDLQFQSASVGPRSSATTFAEETKAPRTSMLENRGREPGFCRAKVPGREAIMVSVTIK